MKAKPKSKTKAGKPPSYAALYRGANRELQALLTLVLQTAFLRKKAGIKLANSGSVSLGLEITFLSSTEMKKLNLKYRKKDYATDVLSFPAPAVFQKSGHLGDILICADVLKRQAKEQKHSVQEELRVLLTHGLLHLLDFDHERGTEAAKLMSKWEKKLLGATGLIDRA